MSQFPPAKPPVVNPFADSVNPYAAPQQAQGYVQVAQSPFAGLWRQGDLLVMHKRAPLPEICLKSNQKATRWLPRSLSWHHPAIYIVVLISPIIYIIVALVVRKTANIQLPLTDEWYSRRRRHMLIAWSTVLLCCVLFVVGCAWADQNSVAPFLILLSVFGVIGAAIYGIIACRLVTPTRITDEYVFLKGVHPDFLNRLETWQWNI